MASDAPTGVDAFRTVARLFLRPALLTGGGVVCLVAALAAPKAGWYALGALLAFVIGPSWGWWAAKQWAAILDAAPLAAIGSAAPGHVMLEGRVQALPGAPLTSPGSGEYCCWYKYKRTQAWDKRGVFGLIRGVLLSRGESDGKFRWMQDEWEQTSDWSFILRDSSGECVITPSGATVLPTQEVSLGRESDQEREEGWERSEDLIQSGDAIMVIGELQTGAGPQELQQQTDALLNQWKADQPTLRKRFDLDGDGVLNEKEWQLARNAALREAKAARASSPPQKTVCLPTDGQPFLISAITYDRLANHIRSWLVAFPVVAAAGIAISIWTAVRHVAR